MKPKTPFLIVGAVLFGAVTFWLVANSRAATETPEYKVIRKIGEVEIRDYPALTVATAPMGEGEMNGSFGKLFRYITGTNEQSQKISMTSPVLIDNSGEQRTMSFIVPKDIAEKGAPKPTGESVSLGKVAAARYAVLRFGGGRSADNEKKAIEKLQAWLESQNIPSKGQPMFAYYDPPWTPTFMRRNEVMLRINADAR
jgi:DNA gyrase inhibitor GyrI